MGWARWCGRSKRGGRHALRTEQRDEGGDDGVVWREAREWTGRKEERKWEGVGFERDKGRRWVFVGGFAMLSYGFLVGLRYFSCLSLSLLVCFVKLLFLLSLSGGHRQR